MSRDFIDDIALICDAYGHLKPVTSESIELRRNMFEEEVRETAEAFGWYAPPWIPMGKALDPVKIADGFVDSIVIALGGLVEFFSERGALMLWNEVQRSNEAKIGPDGQVVRREDGKVLKPEGWTPPNLEAMMNEPMAQHAKEVMASLRSPSPPEKTNEEVYKLKLLQYIFHTDDPLLIQQKFERQAWLSKQAEEKCEVLRKEALSNPDYLSSQVFIACLHQCMGKTEKAVRLTRDILEIVAKCGGLRGKPDELPPAGGEAGDWEQT